MFDGIELEGVFFTYFCSHLKGKEEFQLDLLGGIDTDHTYQSMLAVWFPKYPAWEKGKEHKEGGRSGSVEGTEGDLEARGWKGNEELT